MAIVSHELASQFYRSIDTRNEKNTIVWNRSTDSVALAHSWSDENRAMVFDATALLEQYGLDQAYSGYYDEKSRAVKWGDLYRLRWGNCPSGSMNDGPDGVKVTRWTHKDVLFANNLCLVHHPAEPEGRVVTIATTGIHSTDLVLDRDIELIEVTQPNGEKRQLQAGWTRPITWWPSPVIGCDWPGLTPAPQWCGIRFVRENAREVGRSPELVISRALGLAKVSLEMRFPDLRWEQAGASSASAHHPNPPPS